MWEPDGTGEQRAVPLTGERGRVGQRGVWGWAGLGTGRVRDSQGWGGQGWGQAGLGRAGLGWAGLGRAGCPAEVPASGAAPAQPQGCPSGAGARLLGARGAEGGVRAGFVPRALPYLAAARTEAALPGAGLPGRARGLRCSRPPERPESTASDDPRFQETDRGGVGVCLFPLVTFPGKKGVRRGCLPKCSAETPLPPLFR